MNIKFLLSTIIVLLLSVTITLAQTQIFKFNTPFGCVESDTISTANKAIIVNYKERFIHIAADAFPFIVTEVIVQANDSIVEYHWKSMVDKRTGFFTMNEMGCISLIVHEINGKLSMYSAYKIDVINARNLLSRDNEEHILYEVPKRN